MTIGLSALFGIESLCVPKGWRQCEGKISHIMKIGIFPIVIIHNVSVMTNGSASLTQWACRTMCVISSVIWILQCHIKRLIQSCCIIKFFFLFSVFLNSIRKKLFITSNFLSTTLDDFLTYSIYQVICRSPTIYKFNIFDILCKHIDILN